MHRAPVLCVRKGGRGMGKEGGRSGEKEKGICCFEAREEGKAGALLFLSRLLFSSAEKRGNFLIATPDLAPPAGSEAEQVALGADEEEAAASDTAGTAKLSGGRKG